MKNKFVKSFICIVLIFSCCLSSLACKNQSETGAVVPTKKSLIKDGVSEYVIVMPEKASDTVITATREIKNFFEEATGFSFPVISDTHVDYSKDKYISVGKTKLAEKKKFTVSKEQVKEQGFKIKTIGDSIYLLGASDLGTLYSAYEFLKYELEYEYYFTDVYALNRNVANVSLKKYNLTEIPDIGQLTEYTVGVIDNSVKNRQRMRVTAVEDWLIPANGAYLSVHNAFHILPKVVYEKTNPNFYTDDATQICFTAHGVEKDENDMINAIVDCVKKGLEESVGSVFSLSHMDNADACTCDKCLEIARDYGSNSAAPLILLNKVSDYFKGWFETEEGSAYADRELKFVFFAYQDFIEPPTNKNLKCNDNVGVYFASDSMNYSLSLDAEGNKEIMEYLRQWRNFTDLFFYWTYGVNFNHYLIPYDSFYSKQDLYKEFAKSNAYAINDQNQVQNRTNSVSWGNLKTYLSTKLRWNVNANLAELTRGFFNTCYLEASDLMYSVYLQYKAHFEKIKTDVEAGKIAGVNIGALGSIFGAINKPELWHTEIVRGWYQKMKQALEIVGAKRNEDQRYQRAYEMIAAEIVSPIYMMIALHETEFSDSEIYRLKVEFKTYCQVAKIDNHHDSSKTAIEELFENLGIV